MTARLLGRTGKAQGIEHPVSDLVTLGSGAGNALRIDSRMLSRQHAQVVKVGGAYVVEDLGSRNGTFLNGQRVKRFPLRNLDVISLGPDVDLIFVESGSPVVTLPRPEPLRVTVVWLDGPLAGRVEEVPPHAGLLLGRASGLEALTAISRRHAVITLRGDRVTVEDLGSANGTLVNGTPITAVTPVAAGDEVSLGGLVRLRVAMEGAASPAREAVQGDTPETIAFQYKDQVRDRPLDVQRGIPPAPVPPPPPAPPLPDAQVRVSPPAAEPARGAVPAESDGLTMVAPREAAVAPRADGAGPRVPPLPRPGPAEVEGGTMVAPREAAVLPRPAPPLVPSSSEGDTFGGGPDAAAIVPDGLAARARAARQVPDATMSAPRGPAPPPAVKPAAPVPAADFAADAAPISGVILDGPTRVTLNLGTFEIGRRPEADLTVDSRDISRRHARLYVREHDVELEDLETVNGCFVNDVAVSGRAAVPDGARVRFATVEYAVMYVRAREQQP